MFKVAFQIGVYQLQSCIFIEIFDSEQEVDSLPVDVADGDCNCYHQTM